MASPPAPPPPPPPPPYRPWEDTSPATPPSFLNGRPSLPLPALSAMTDRRPSAPSSASSQYSRKRRRLSNEGSEQLRLPTISPNSPPGIHSVDVRGGDGGGGGGGGGGNSGGGGSMYPRGPDTHAGGDITTGSAYSRPLNHHNTNHFTSQQPPHLPQPSSRPATPSRQPQQFPYQPPHALTTLVSSIHNLTLSLASSDPPFASNSSLQSPSQIAPSQISSIEALTACLETVHTLLLRLKPPAQTQPQLQEKNPTEQQAAYISHLSSLQHSLSTLELAHSTLKGDHTNLLSAISRSQTRTSALDRKLLVCTEENESLSNERERLMGVVEGLEESLVEVRAERDDMQLEMRNSGAQWGTIVHNAGRLEQSAGKVEKALRKEVGDLKDDLQKLRAAVAGGGGGCTAVGEADEKEKMELRRRVRELESCLEEIRSEGKGIWELAERISQMGKGIAECRRQ